jgi:hypothetical protein
VKGLRVLVQIPGNSDVQNTKYYWFSLFWNLPVAKLNKKFLESQKIAS